MAMMSALSTGRLYPPEKISGTHFCQGLSSLQGHIAARRIKSMRNVKPSTFWPVALCLNQLSYHVPLIMSMFSHLTRLTFVTELLIVWMFVVTLYNYSVPQIFANVEECRTFVKQTLRNLFKTANKTCTFFKAITTLFWKLSLRSFYVNNAMKKDSFLKF